MSKTLDTHDARRKFVMDHMAYSGSHRDRLTDREWGFVYLCADGFGTITERWARSQCWDWSHVRDSSPAGVLRMADAIASLLVRKGRRWCDTCGDMVFHNLLAHRKDN